MEDARHVRVTQPGRRLGLAQKALPASGCARKVRVDDLERHRRVEIEIARLVGRAHRSSPQFPWQTVRTLSEFRSVDRHACRRREANRLPDRRFDPSDKETMQAVDLTVAAMQRRAALLADEGCVFDWFRHSLSRTGAPPLSGSRDQHAAEITQLIVDVLLSGNGA